MSHQLSHSSLHLNLKLLPSTTTLRPQPRNHRHRSILHWLSHSSHQPTLRVLLQTLRPQPRHHRIMIKFLHPSYHHLNLRPLTLLPHSYPYLELLAFDTMISSRVIESQVIRSIDKTIESFISLMVIDITWTTYRPWYQSINFLNTLLSLAPQLDCLSPIIVIGQFTIIKITIIMFKIIFLWFSLWVIDLWSSRVYQNHPHLVATAELRLIHATVGRE